MSISISTLLDEQHPDTPSVFSSVLHVRPATGADHPVVRAAIYADGSTSWDTRNAAHPGPVISTVQRGAEQVRLALIASVEARAHALTTALRQALADAEAGVPNLELYAAYDARADQYTGLIADAWSAPHRAADAYWREALLPQPGKHDPKGWARFHHTEVGSQLDLSQMFSPEALLRYYPTTLLLGADPRIGVLNGTNGNERQEDAARPRSRIKPLGRLCRSEIVAQVDGLYWRTVSTRRPAPAASGTVIYKAEDGDWTLDPEKALRANGKPVLYPTKNGSAAGKAANVGLDDYPAVMRQVPDIYARHITVSSYLSLTGIRRLAFPDFDADQRHAAHSLLVAMGIAAILGAERDLHIRSECDLVLDDRADAVVREVAWSDRPPSADCAITYGQAVDALHDAAQLAGSLQVWEPVTIRLVARSELANLIEPGVQGE